LKTIQYKEFPQKVRNFVESYFCNQLQKVSTQLSLLHISLEERPQNYPSFIKAEFIPPYKISYYTNDTTENIRWDGIVHDTTHFFQYHMDTNEFQKSREVVKTAAFTNFGVYLENSFEKEAFKVQEEYNKYCGKVLSWQESIIDENPILCKIKDPREVVDVREWDMNASFYAVPLSASDFNNPDLEIVDCFIGQNPETLLRRYHIAIKQLKENKKFLFIKNIETVLKENLIDPQVMPIQIISQKLSWQEPPEDLTGWLVKITGKSSGDNTYYRVITKTIDSERLIGSWAGATERQAIKFYKDFLKGKIIGESEIRRSNWASVIPLYKVGLDKHASDNFDSYKDQNTEMYQKRLNQYNENEGAEIFWSSKNAQEKRFEALLDIGDLTDKEILDVGCGYCDLLDYIEKRDIKIKNYIGVDIVPEIVKKSRELHPNTNIEVRDIQKEPIEKDSFDYVYGSGIFAIDNPNWNQYTVEMLKGMLNSARVGVGVNFLKQQEMNRLSWAEPKFYEGYKGWLVKTVGRGNYTYYGVITNIFINTNHDLEIYAFWGLSEREAINFAHKVTALNYRFCIVPNNLEYFAKYFQPVRYIGFEKQSSLTQLKYTDPKTVLNLIKQNVTDKVVLKDNYLADDFSIFLYKS